MYLYTLTSRIQIVYGNATCHNAMFLLEGEEKLTLLVRVLEYLFDVKLGRFNFKTGTKNQHKSSTINIPPV